MLVASPDSDGELLAEARLVRFLTLTTPGPILKSTKRDDIQRLSLGMRPFLPSGGARPRSVPLQA
jgi:hypothetical protein